ncbi:MAG: T9SS type A sorting domain-containing protein [Bacteroidota bacterium]
MAIVHPVFAQIPNSGFENWTSIGNYIVPDEWGNLNPVTNPSGLYTCQKGAPGSPGAAYLKLVSRNIPGMGIKPGIAVSGELNTTTFQPVSGFAYNDRPVSLKGKWQYMAGGADQGYIAAYFTKWNPASHTRMSVGQFIYPLPGMVMSWQDFTLPITYFNGLIPDSAMIVFSASGTVPVSGSYIYIDNLSFYGSTVGFEEQSVSPGLLIYPNPVINDKLMIDLKNRETAADYIEILDLHGKLMSKQTLKSKQFPVSMDVSALSAGEYLLLVTMPSGTRSSKFIRK